MKIHQRSLPPSNGQRRLITPKSGKSETKWWEQATKQLTRTMALKIELPLYYWVVEEVLDSLENDTLLVFNPDDERAFECAFNKKEEYLVNHRATLPVKIREWLPVGCQSIVDLCAANFQAEKNPHLLGVYRNNAHQCLYPITGDTPPGPAALHCEVLLNLPSWLRRETKQGIDAFKLVIAHELVHAFDLMRFAVPAAMDWDEFWRKPLGEGCKCDLAHEQLEMTSLFIDDYDSMNELIQVQQFWPSAAPRWFKAYQKERESNSATGN
jgi:hypothetical protein